MERNVNHAVFPCRGTLTITAFLQGAGKILDLLGTDCISAPILRYGQY